MRISTNSLYETGTTQLGTLQSNMARIQQQVATGKKNLTAADDPIASSRALEVTQSQSVNNQFAVNRQNARNGLSEVEIALTNTTMLIQDVQQIAVNANTGILSAADRESFAVELSGRLDDLFGLANTADGTGSYLFSGYKTATLPFGRTETGATYQGDQGERQLQVGSSRQMAISNSGSAVFENNMTGNGTFETRAGATNLGSGIVSTGSVVNQSALTGNRYELTFAVSGTPAVTTYTVLNQDTGLPPAGAPGPMPYQAGRQIEFDGVSLDVKGAPVNGDRFTVEPSERQSIFTTLTEMIATLRLPATAPGAQGQRTNGLNKAQENLTAALDNILSVRAGVGARLKEIDTLDTAGKDLDIQYQSALSDLQDVDVVAALSNFSKQQTMLEAAQKSFKALSGLSLFNFI
jgi:flagellar hook-associated protein 3 FlgL